jgi:negative regulator of sigma E activity
MSSQPNPIDVEALLAQALHPVDPPEHLADDLEERLHRISVLAADQIDSWEAGAFHDPRTWVKPAAALAVGTAAASAAAVLGVRHRRGRQQNLGAGPVVFARKAIDTIGNEVTRRLGS